MARRCPTPKPILPCCPSGIQPITETAPIPYVPEGVPELCPYANVPRKAHALIKINSKTISNMLFHNFPPLQVNGRLPGILATKSRSILIAARGKPVPSNMPAEPNSLLPQLGPSGPEGSGAVPETSAHAGKSCSRSLVCFLFAGLAGLFSSRIGGPIFLCSRSALNCS